MNVCLYILYIIVNYVFGHKMIVTKIVVHEHKKVSELVTPIFDRWSRVVGDLGIYVNCEIYLSQGRSLNLENSRFSYGHLNKASSRVLKSSDLLVYASAGKTRNFMDPTSLQYNELK